MLDIKLIREKQKLVEKNLERRKEKDKIILLHEVIKHDKEWRAVLKKVQELKQKKNAVTKEIGKKKDNKKITQMKKISKDITKLEETQKEFEEKVRHGLMRIPNILHDSVPYGKGDEDNQEIKRWGKPPKFGFKPKNHLDIATRLGLIDADRAAKVAGRGFFFLKGDLALLDYALLRYTIDFMMNKGFLLIEPPFMLRRKPYEGVVSLEDFHDQLYKIDKEDLYLIATSEHPMAAMFMDEVLNKKNLPLKLVGISPCFRKEVGAHGKYTKGLFRMHQFNKIEQFVFCLPDQSWKIHEELQKNAEELYRSLELPYRVLNVCTGDIGDLAAKKYDTDVWMSDGKFREIGSNSNCTDYQARRLNIRYRDGEGKSPSGFVHTLNNTAIATSRTMVALLEMNQQKDGSVIIPEVLRPYMNGKDKLEKI